jgi:uncharacterized protein (TIGR00106 family)
MITATGLPKWPAAGLALVLQKKPVRYKGMLAELTITPLGRGTHLSADLARILKIIDESQIRYTLTPFGTCLEGTWDEIMSVVRHCHEQARSFSQHVLTTIRLEDDAGVNDKLIQNVAALERRAGHELRREVLVETK